MKRVPTGAERGYPELRPLRNGVLAPRPAAFAAFSSQSFSIVGIPSGALGIVIGWTLHSRERVNPERFWFGAIAGTLLGVFASLVTTGVRHIWIRSRKEPRADRAHGR